MAAVEIPQDHRHRSDMRRAQVLERFGNVLNLGGMVSAGLLVVAGVPIALNEQTATDGWMVFAAFLVLAVLVWFFGNSLRYILAGKMPAPVTATSLYGIPRSRKLIGLAICLVLLVVNVAWIIWAIYYGRTLWLAVAGGTIVALGYTIVEDLRSLLSSGIRE